MDRKKQVRRLVAERYPNIPEQDRESLVDFVWKEAQRESRIVQQSRRGA